MAIEDLKKAISIYEKNSDYYYLSMIYLAKGMFEEAKWAIDNAIRLKSDHENYYSIRAYCFDYLSQKDEAIKDYTRFLTYHRKVELLKWEHYFSYIRRAILFMEKSDYQSAMKDINSAIKIDGTGDDIYYLKFMIEAKSGEYDNSYEDLKKALLNGFNDRAELEEFVISVPFINQNKVIEITDKYMKTKKPINGFDYYNWDYIIKKSFDIKE
jgi:Tfp pilus assembly protein PilF